LENQFNLKKGLTTIYFASFTEVELTLLLDITFLYKENERYTSTELDHQEVCNIKSIHLFEKSLHQIPTLFIF